MATNGQAYRVDPNTYAATPLNLTDPGVMVAVPAINRRYAYFAQVFNGDVTIVDTQTGNATRTAPAGIHSSTANPPVLWGLAARGDGSKLYVSSPLRHTVYVCKADGSADTQFLIPGQPWGLALSPDQNTLWIAVDSAVATGAKEVDALDLTTGKLDRVSLPGVAHGVYVPSSGHYAYVPSEAADAVYAVDMTAPGHPYQTISLGRPGYGMAFAGGEGWTADGPGNSVSVFALK